MVTKNLSNDFMAKVLEDAAWKELSGDFAWNEQLLEKYKYKVEWKTISSNSNILWTVSMLEKFKNRIDWESPAQTTSTCSRQKTWRSTKTIGTGGNCRAIHHWN